MNNQWTASWTAARVHTCEAQLAEAKARAFASVLLTASGSGYPPHGTGSEIYDYYKHLLDIRRPDLLRRSRGAAAAALDVRRDLALRLDDAGGFLPADERVDRRALPDRHGLLFLGARRDGRGGVLLGLPAYGRTGRRRQTGGQIGRRGRRGAGEPPLDRLRLGVEARACALRLRVRRLRGGARGEEEQGEEATRRHHRRSGMTC